MDNSLLYMSLFVFAPFVLGVGVVVYSFSTLKAAQSGKDYKKLLNAAFGFWAVGIAAFDCLQVYWALLLAIAGVVSSAVSYRMWRINRTVP